MIFETKFVRASGLGNRLFPWARSKLLAKATGAKCIQPKWHDIRRGPLFRGGVNYLTVPRKIWLFDNFLDDDDDLRRSGLPVLERSMSRISEHDLGSPASLSALAQHDKLVTVQGDGEFFAGLHADHAYIENALWKITRDKWKNLVKRLDTFDVTLNVRCGKDFRTAKSDKDFLEKGLILTPVNWFANLVERLRAEIGSTVSVQVVSDGTSNDLRPILRLPNTHFCETPAAISDLWAVRKSRMIIATGGSSFPAWASFLGRCPIVSIEGQSFSWFRLDMQADFPVLTMSRDNADDAALRRVVAALDDSRGREK